MVIGIPYLKRKSYKTKYLFSFVYKKLKIGFLLLFVSAYIINAERMEEELYV